MEFNSTFGSSLISCRVESIPFLGVTIIAPLYSTPRVEVVLTPSVEYIVITPQNLLCSFTPQNLLGV